MRLLGQSWMEESFAATDIPQNMSSQNEEEEEDVGLRIYASTDYGR